MTTTFADIIPIERLISGVEIIIPGFGPVEVYGVRFDGEGYAVDYPRSTAGGWDDMDMHYVPAGGSVKHAGIGEPRWVRPESEVTADEWQAKFDACMAASSDLEIQVQRNLGSIATMHGHVCQPVDEARRAQFYEAVAKALDVPAVAAE